MPFDSTAYHTETKPDLSTPRARLLYLRDVVVPRIPEGELDMSYWDCGTTACRGSVAAMPLIIAR